MSGATERVQLNHFKPYEFRDWYDQISPRLLVLLDLFRWQWGHSVWISPVTGSIGRNRGESQSQHNVDRWGEVRAVDCFPEFMFRLTDIDRAIDIATQIGITGIGIYTEARPHPMAHFDVRTTARPGSPAIWGAVRRYTKAGREAGWDYVSLEAALEKLHVR